MLQSKGSGGLNLLGGRGRLLYAIYRANALAPPHLHLCTHAPYSAAELWQLLDIVPLWYWTSLCHDNSHTSQNRYITGPYKYHTILTR